MSISPPRAFALGAVSVLVLAGTFVAGIGIGNSDPILAVPESEIRMAHAVVACPEPPGFRATRASHERYDNCITSQRIQTALLESGVQEVDVQVSSIPSAQLVGPEETTAVVARVVGRDPEWDAAAAAAAISVIARTPIEHVTIVDERLASLFAAPSPRGPVAVDPKLEATAPAKVRP